MTFRPIGAIAAPILARLYRAHAITNEIRGAELRRLAEENKARVASMDATIKRIQPTGKEPA